MDAQTIAISRWFPPIISLTCLSKCLAGITVSRVRVWSAFIAALLRDMVLLSSMSRIVTSQSAVSLDRPKGRGWVEVGYYRTIERVELPSRSSMRPRKIVYTQWIHTGWERRLGDA